MQEEETRALVLLLARRLKLTIPAARRALETLDDWPDAFEEDERSPGEATIDQVVVAALAAFFGCGPNEAADGLDRLRDHHARHGGF